ncbi:hypothetical protein NFI96_000721 [Prochilodus magdalenae]|nr:hypothetical protein NFI96_000721 [Prochilodus magdalenae]
MHIWLNFCCKLTVSTSTSLWAEKDMFQHLLLFREIQKKKLFLKNYSQIIDNQKFDLISQCLASQRHFGRIAYDLMKLFSAPKQLQHHQQPQQKEHLYKILVIGDLGVGKSSIIKRYVHHNFSPNYRATIGVDFALKVLNLEQETIRLQLWDIAG